MADYISLPGLVATSAITQYFPVVLSSTAGEVKEGTAGDTLYIGICQNDPGAGEAADVAAAGVAFAVAGTGVAVHSALTVNSTGVVATTTDNDASAGLALEACSNKSEIIKVLVLPVRY